LDVKEKETKTGKSLKVYKEGASPYGQKFYKRVVCEISGNGWRGGKWVL